MTPLISVVIPTFNREKALKRALESVINQSYKNWEIIVVDNHSSDGTEEMIKNINNKKISFFRIYNEGIIAKSRNYGISKSEGEYIAFLDSDDWWSPEKLENISSFFNQNYDIYFHDLIIKKKLSPSLLSFTLKGRKVYTPIYMDLLRKGNPIATSSVVVKKDLICKLEGFSEHSDLIASEDFDLWIRLSKITENFKYIPSKLGFYWSGNENTSNSRLSIIHLNYIYEKYIKDLSETKFDANFALHHYSMARALFLERKYIEASEILWKIIFMKLNYLIKAKVLYMILILYSRRFFKLK